MSRLRRSMCRISVTLMATVVGCAVLSGIAAATPVPSGPASQVESSDLTEGSAIVLPDGSSTILPKDWGKMTVDDLAAIGIVAGRRTSDEQATRLGVAVISPPSAEYAGVAKLGSKSVSPMDSSGCSVDVCIYLTGTNGVVRGWSTNGFYRSTGSTFAAYWRSNIIIGTSDGVYAPRPGLVVSRWASGNLYFSQPAQLCNTWVGIAGKPCETAY